MRILFISTNVVRWGGSEELWKEIALSAKEKGHEVMASVYMHKPLPEPLVNLRKRGVIIHKRPFPSYYKGQRFTGRALAELKLRSGLENTSLDWQKVQRWNPEVVLISSGETFDYSINNESFIIKFCQARNIPFFLISQFNWEHDMDISNEFRKDRGALTKSSSGHFFVSYRNLQNAKMQLAMNIPRARIISNPIKIKLKQPITYPQSDMLNLAVVARYQPYIKGQDLLLQAIHSKQFDQFDFKLTFYGSGDGKQHLQNLVRYYELGHKVQVCDSVSDVTSIWKENQILVLSSRAEGTSLAMLEAMYCGRTAIVTNAGDSALWIGERGYVAESNSVESLRKTLLMSLRDAARWEELGNDCREFVLNNHIEDQATQLMECLTKERELATTGYSVNDFELRFNANRLLKNE